MNIYDVHADAFTNMGKGPSMGVYIQVEADSLRQAVDVAVALIIKEMPQCTAEVWSVELVVVEDDEA